MDGISSSENNIDQIYLVPRLQASKLMYNHPAQEELLLQLLLSLPDSKSSEEKHVAVPYVIQMISSSTLRICDRLEIPYCPPSFPATSRDQTTCMPSAKTFDAVSWSWRHFYCLHPHVNNREVTKNEHCQVSFWKA